MRYAALTPPKAETLKVKKSSPKSTAAMAHAGICIGSGIK